MDLLASQGTGSGMLPQVPVFHVGMQTGPGSPGPPLQPSPGPGGPAGCPPGLEVLTRLDQVLVHQRVEVLEVLTGWETNNVYTVTDSGGRQLFVATEDSDILSAQFLGPSRPFTIRLHDNGGRQVLTLTRPLRCSCCCCPCCLQTLEVQSPPGSPIGYVEQDWHPVLPKFSLLDQERDPRLAVRGPCCHWGCMSDLVFQVMSPDGSEVGRICKQWGGFLREGLTDADTFGIWFPSDLEVKMKALMLGTCFLLDFIFFEHQPRNDR